MKFRPGGEARSRRQFAEQQILQISVLVGTHPDAVPALYPGYKEEVQQVVNRLYVPNIEIKGGAAHATTPKAYRTKNAIGVIAVYSDEPLVMDRWLLQSSERQQQQQQQFLATHTSPTRIGMQDIQSNTPDTRTETLDRGIIAGSWHNGYRVSRAPFFNTKTGEASYVEFSYMSPLAVNMGLPQNLATSMHEVDHLVEMDGSGVGPNDYIDNRAATMTSEQRGHHVERVVGEYVLNHGLPMPSNLTERLPTVRDIDTIRTTHLGEGQFGFSHELAQAYHDAGLLDHVLTPEYQDRLRLQ